MDASRALANVQKALEIKDPEAISAELKDTVAGYNRDDCVSARGLRDWLEGIRADLGGGRGGYRPAGAADG